MTDLVYIPFPKALYTKILIRSGGRLDPAKLAASEVEQFIERTRRDPNLWTEEGYEDFFLEDYVGDFNKGYQWKEVFLPNQTDLRFTYKGRNHHATIEHEQILHEISETADGNGKRECLGPFESPSQWVSHVAGNTARNAWRDVWIRRPGEQKWTLAENVRREMKKGDH